MSEGLPSCLECGLAALQKRSQIDFEIDFFERVLRRNPNYDDVLRNLGELFSIKGWTKRALQVDQRLVELRPSDPSAWYNLSCSLALSGAVEDAVETLRRAIVYGFRDFGQLAVDPDFDSIRSLAPFQELLSELHLPAVREHPATGESAPGAP